jgi:hypothetical protein
MPPKRLPALLAAALTLTPGLARAQTEETEAALSRPALTFRGFTDVDFRVPWGEASEDNNAFTLGQLDLYATSRLTNSIGVLAETVLELDEQQEIVVDVERIQITYRRSDAFRLAVGRGHTALGYWNEAYHHGLLLQPTVERPEGLKFEDDGGLLPVHFVGAELAGRAARSRWDLAYVLYVANGRGPEAPVVQGARDENPNKAVGGKLSLSHQGPRSFTFGGIASRDRIPANPLAGSGASELDETILGAHFVFTSRHADLLSEYFHIRHVQRTGGQSFTHEAGYALGVLNTGSFHPYAGIDWTRVAAGDPFYGPGYSSLTRVLVGLRWDVASFNALKLEYQHDDRPEGISQAIIVQSAFTF